MLKYRDEWAFISFHDGLGGPPIFVAKHVVSEKESKKGDLTY
jgi:hypothetical protein